MGTALSAEFRVTAPAGTISDPPQRPPADRYVERYAGRSCAHPSDAAVSPWSALWQTLATVLFTAAVVTAILCIAHIRTGQVAAEATGTAPTVTDIGSFAPATSGR